ncbi:hypothetical protein [Streptomyces boluensis]|uniref:Uncharacterized protein n=1 Tax=Streptomyces boluensis TaxID=1775135 RepID=A0A964UVJ7_9ACTN|nr:hypothetical protein [Streptomyces boluensis]NBE55160.1 hypothetical protein [Streptomyces boluensis]
MGDVAGEAAALVRCALAARGWGSVLRFVCFRHRQVVAAFDRTALPLVEHTVQDGALRRTLHTSLLGTSMKVGLAMWGYASMAKVAFDPELTVLASSFTRLYDDLIDNCDREHLDEDLAGLFAGEPFRPHGDLEELLLVLHRAIAARLPHAPDDPIHTVLRELHAFQVRSRAQRSAAVSAGEVLEITRGKGGLGMVALLALLRPAMPTAERAVLMEVGDLFQLLDDIHDFTLDRSDGLTTSATLGLCSLTGLATRITALRPHFTSCYGTAAPLSAHLALTLLGAPFAVRRRRRAPRGRGQRAGPVRLLFSRAGNVRP